MAAASAELEAFWQGAEASARIRYENVKLIGSGAYSVVARATDTKTGKQVAIKRIAEVFYDATEAKKVLREIRLLRDFAHPNIIALRGLITPISMEQFDDIFMVTDFMESDLRRIIKARERIAHERVRSYMAQLLAALHHVHAHAGIHRDLKPANILISPTQVTPATPHGLLRLCDFGLARVDATAQNQTKRELDAAAEQDDELDDADADPAAFAEDSGGGSAVAASAEEPEEPRKPPTLKKQMTHYVVTRWYRAPEVILRQRYTSAIDLWAVGCIFKELLELSPASKFRTGALFPGRYCIPFSFDEDMRERSRFDQLAVITRVLGDPTPAETSWADTAALDDLKAVCSTKGTLSSLDVAERKKQLDGRMTEACPAITGRAEELDLLRRMLEFDPTDRPSAATALGTPYFRELSPAEQPVVTPQPDPSHIEAAFRFEDENLAANELRILLANDLFRMATEEEEATLAAQEQAQEQAQAAQGGVEAISLK